MRFRSRRVGRQFQVQVKLRVWVQLQKLETTGVSAGVAEVQRYRDFSEEGQKHRS